MKKRNTKLRIWISYLLLVISGFFAVVGAISDFFGATEALENRKDVLNDFINTVLLFGESNWKWVLIITVAIFVVIILIRKSNEKNRRKRLTESLSWFDAKRQNTKYSGGTEDIYELKCFFRQKTPGLSWWAITGVAGIGKTRLVTEIETDKEFSNSDIQYLKSYHDYRTDSLRKRVDTILESPNLNNFIIAEDAQIYMDNIGMLISYIANKSIFEIGDHRFRVLLIIRTGEDEDLEGRYEQLRWGSALPAIEKLRFNKFNNEIRLEKYKDKDIDEIVKSFAINTKKNLKQKALTKEEISVLQRKTKETLHNEGMDPNHLRPLFAMFIADAILSGKDPMNWSRNDVLDYAVVEREEQYWKNEIKVLHDNKYICNCSGLTSKYNFRHP